MSNVPLLNTRKRVLSVFDKILEENSNFDDISTLDIVGFIDSYFTSCL